MRTFWRAVSGVNGGNGGLVSMVLSFGVRLSAPPPHRCGADSFKMLEHTRAMPNSSAHPPSPRRQRAETAQRAPGAEASRARRSGYLRAHWRGELPLAVAVIVSAGLVWGAVQIVGFASRHVLLTDYPQAAAALLMLELLLLIPGVVWWGAGVMRSAARHVGRGGSAL